MATIGGRAFKFSSFSEDKTFSKKETPDDLPEVSVKRGEELMDVVLSNKVLTSKAEFKRLIDEGGVRILPEGEKVQDFHFKLENRQELLGVLKEWKKLYEDKNIKNGYSIWIVELGLDNNMMVLTEYFKDGADFYTSQKEDNALMEAEASVLWAKMSPFLTSVENKYGSPRPDLGYVKK